MDKKEIVYNLKVKSRKYEEMSDRERLRGSNTCELYSAKSDAYETAAFFVEENLDGDTHSNELAIYKKALELLAEDSTNTSLNEDKQELIDYYLQRAREANNAN